MAKKKQKLTDEQVLKIGYRDDPYKHYDKKERITDMQDYKDVTKKRQEIAAHNKRYEELSKPINKSKLQEEMFYRYNPEVDRTDDEGNVINKADWKACATNTRYGSFSHGNNSCGCSGGKC